MKRLVEEQKPYPRIEVGTRLYTGHVVSEREAKAINLATDRINTFIFDGFQVPEQLLNGRHNLFQAIALQYKI